MTSKTGKMTKEQEFSHRGDLWVVRKYQTAGDLGIITEFCDEEGDQVFWVFGDIPTAGFPWVIAAYECGINRGRELGKYDKQLEIQRVLGLDKQ